MKDQVLSQAEIDALFAQGGDLAPEPKAEKTGLASPAVPQAPLMPPPLAAGAPAAAGALPISLLSDVELEVTVQLGQTKKNVRQILELGPGHVLELDRLAGDSVDVLVNGRLVAKAEVVVIGDNFGVRITELIRPKGGTGA